MLKAGARKLGKYEGWLGGERLPHLKVAGPDLHIFQEKQEIETFFTALLSYN